MRRIYVILLIVLVGSFVKMNAQTSVARAQAMYIYNFARYIAWPADYQSGNFVIGILGTSNLERELENYCATKKVGFQNIQIKKYKDAAEINKCHILFVSYGKSNKLHEVVAKVSGFSTLIITEKRGLITDGSAINFIIGEDRLKFELNVSNATKYGLRVSSKLQKMATVVN